MNSIVSRTIVMHISLSDLIAEAEHAYSGSMALHTDTSLWDVSTTAENHIDDTCEAHDIVYGASGTVCVPADKAIALLNTARHECDNTSAALFIESMVNSFASIVEEEGDAVYLVLFHGDGRHPA